MKTAEFSSYPPIATFEGITLTQQERDALASRIEKVILERQRRAAEQRRRARLRQMQSLERPSERHGDVPAVAQ